MSLNFLSQQYLTSCWCALVLLWITRCFMSWNNPSIYTPLWQRESSSCDSVWLTGKPEKGIKPGKAKCPQRFSLSRNELRNESTDFHPVTLHFETRSRNKQTTIHRSQRQREISTRLPTDFMLTVMDSVYSWHAWLQMSWFSCTIRKTREPFYFVVTDSLCMLLFPLVFWVKNAQVVTICFRTWKWVACPSGSWHKNSPKQRIRIITAQSESFTCSARLISIVAIIDAKNKRK